VEWKLAVALVLGFAGVGAGFVIGDHQRGNSSLIVVTTTFEGHTLEQTVTAVQTDTRTVHRTKTVTETIRSTAVVYFPQPSGTLVYHPRRIGLPQDQLVRRVHWQGYGGANASGTGLRSNPSCTSTCPQGQHRWLRATIQLSDLGVCRGVFVYRHLDLDGIAADLPGLTAANCAT